MDLGVIGIGKFGANHVRILKELGHAVYVSDVDKVREEEIKKMYGVDSLTEKITLDAVCVIASSNKHYEIVKYWLEKKVHVFCEKPLCFTSKEAQELIDLAEQNEVILAVGHIFRFTDGGKFFKKMFEAIEPKNIVEDRSCKN